MFEKVAIFGGLVKVSDEVEREVKPVDGNLSLLVILFKVEGTEVFEEIVGSVDPDDLERVDRKLLESPQFFMTEIETGLSLLFVVFLTFLVLDPDEIL